MWLFQVFPKKGTCYLMEKPPRPALGWSGEVMGWDRDPDPKAVVFTCGECMCMYVCGYMCVSMYVCETRQQNWISFHDYVPPFCHSLSLVLGFLVGLRRLVNKLPESTCLCLPNVGTILTCISNAAPRFYIDFWGWNSGFQGSLLSGNLSSRSSSLYHSFLRINNRIRIKRHVFG